jgi:hypothetical protein
MSALSKTEMSEEERAAKDVGMAVAKIQTGVITVVFALFGGLGLFVMTAWLLIRKGPNVGFHLRLLGNYFPGYSVTWPGSFVGLCYGAVIGGLVGWLIGTVYNKVVWFRQR